MQMVVWVNFGGLLPGILKCMYGWILEGFSLIIACIVCLGWCPLMTFFSRWRFFFHTFHDESWKSWNKWLGIWKVRTIGEYTHFSLNHDKARKGILSTSIHSLIHELISSYQSPIIPFIHINFSNISNSSSLLFSAKMFIVLLSRVTFASSSSRISNFARRHGHGDETENMRDDFPWGLTQQPFWISNYTLINKHTVDGSNPAPVDRLFIPLFTRYFYIPAGAGFLPSTVATAKEKGVPLKMHFRLRNDAFWYL